MGADAAVLTGATLAVGTMLSSLALDTITGGVACLTESALVSAFWFRATLDACAFGRGFASRRDSRSDPAPDLWPDWRTLGLRVAPLAFAQLLRVVGIAARAVGQGKQFPESIAKVKQVAALRTLRRRGHCLGAAGIASNRAHT